MPSADFYLATETGFDQCLPLVCKLVDKAYQQQHAVFILVPSEILAKTLDDLLWTFRDDAFIPHSLQHQSQLNIQIGFDQTAPKLQDIFINLTSVIPDFFPQFQRILEIVPQDQKDTARKKFRFYKEKNCEITTHDLTKTAETNK